MNSHHATGAFSVSMSPQAETGFAAAAAGSPSPGTAFNRLLLDKQYQGDLQATAQGQMLSAVTTTAGSAGYVALEQVHGSLHGREGSFVLQHSGLMDRGAQQLMITVVPDSGTGGLVGLSGRLQIRISEGRHFYDFDYTLP
jgi:hypothetical protein